MDIEKFISENTNLGGSVVAVTYSKERLIQLFNTYEQSFKLQDDILEIIFKHLVVNYGLKLTFKEWMDKILKTKIMNTEKKLTAVDNNGWIKIESENDLPKENGKQYQVVMKKDKSIHIGFYFEQTHKSQWIENISHYIEIKKPKPPIY